MVWKIVNFLKLNLNVKTLGTEFMYYGIILLIEEIIKLLQPIFIGGLIRYFRFDAPMTRNEVTFNYK